MWRMWKTRRRGRWMMSKGQRGPDRGERRAARRSGPRSRGESGRVRTAGTSAASPLLVIPSSIDFLSLLTYTRHVALSLPRLLSPPQCPTCASSDRNTSTTARSIASSSFPSSPIDPSDGGTSMDRKICFLKRRAASEKGRECQSVPCAQRRWSVRRSRASKAEYHRDAVLLSTPCPSPKTDKATSPQPTCLA